MILLKTTSEAVLPGVFRQWDVLLPFMVYFGQRRSLPEGLILSLFTSHLYSLCSAAPIGVFSSHYLTVFVVARLLSYVIYADAWITVVLLMFSLSIFSRLVLTLVAVAFGHGWPLLSTDNWIWWAILLNTFMGFLVFSWLEALDRMTYKAPRSSIELAENGI